MREIETGRWDICSWREIELESERGRGGRGRLLNFGDWMETSASPQLTSGAYQGGEGGGYKGRREPHELTVMKEFTFFRARKWYFAEWAPPEIFS